MTKNMMFINSKNTFCILFFFTVVTSYGQLTSFPGAEGFGKYATGGRGGNVIFVTNLNNSGAGSLRAACEATGPRTVIFKIGGTINVNTAIVISNPNITIAGQTAPGGGICLKMNNNITSGNLQAPMVVTTVMSLLEDCDSDQAPAILA